MIEDWPNSAAAWERAKRSLSGGVATGLRASAKPHPIYFTGGSGAWLHDVDGNRYRDYVLGWGPNILGHGNPALVAAVERQVRRGATYGSGHELEYLVAERLLEAYPGLDRVLWSNTGTEADLVALRLARAATGREHYIKFEGHYHGWSDQMLVGYRRRDHAGRLSSTESAGQPRSTMNQAHVLPWGDLEAVAAALAVRPDIAAIFVEPVLCNTGVIEPPPGYLAGLRDLCTQHGVVLVFDEVITGMRIARGGAVERYGVVPDLVVLAKALAGGLSLSAVLGRAELLDLTTRDVVHAGTYNGNPLVLAAAQATLDELEAPGVFGELERRGAALARGFRDVLAARGCVGTAHHVGPVVQLALGVGGIRTVGDFLAADQVRYGDLLVELLRRGDFALPGGRWYLSTAHSDEMIAQTLDALDDALAAS